MSRFQIRTQRRAVGFERGRAGRHAAALLVAMLLGVGGGASQSARVQAQEASPLAATIADVKAKWPALHHANTGEVQTLIESGQAVLFDVRSPEEFAVSHLPGATRVDPAMSREAFLAAYGATVKGKTPVFYCAVGARSSKLAERIGEPALVEAGASAKPLTMAGGIFQWNWEQRALVNDKGATDQVHGYDAKWGRLVKPR